MGKICTNDLWELDVRPKTKPHGNGEVTVRGEITGILQGVFHALMRIVSQNTRAACYQAANGLCA